VAQPTTDLYARLAAAYVRGVCGPTSASDAALFTAPLDRLDAAQFDAQRDLAAIGELDRIAEQVEQHLARQQGQADILVCSARCRKRLVLRGLVGQPDAQHRRAQLVEERGDGRACGHQGRGEALLGGLLQQRERGVQQLLVLGQRYCLLPGCLDTAGEAGAVLPLERALYRRD
jgi:hypothetical protein